MIGWTPAMSGLNGEYYGIVDKGSGAKVCKAVVVLVGGLFDDPMFPLLMGQIGASVSIESKLQQLAFQYPVDAIAPTCFLDLAHSP